MNRRFSHSDILVVALGVAVVSSLISLSLADSLHDARTDACIWKAGKLARAVIGYEQQNKSFPLASYAPPVSKPGSKESRASWLVSCLPFTEVHGFPGDEMPVVRWNESPFSLGPKPAMQVVEAFLCPSRTGTHLIDPIDYDIENPPSRTSYFALTATHFCNAKGIGYPPANARTLGDGIMTIPGSDRHCHASQARRVIDGLSRTLLFCESIEERYAAWIDGTSAWVVGAWPSNAISPHGEGGDATGFVTSINTKSAPYLPADRWSGSSERIFGPSTNHQAVTHAYADGQCTSISSNIDARLYLQLISRDDSESLHCCEERHAGVIAGPSAVEVDTAPNRVISLKNDVWGIDIPGAKDMWELEPKPIHEELQAIGPVKRARIVATMNTTNNTKTYNIMRKFIETKCIGPALVVRGHGQPAFLAAHDSLLDGKEPKRSFSFGEDLSIFFYTNSTFGLTIEAIVLKEKTIEVQYRFGVTGPHSRSHLALISLPKLDSGTYDVNMVRRPYHQPVARPLARAYDTYYNARVCTDCQFIVKKE